MGNPYPAKFEDSQGGTRLEGQIDFTDSGNQPGGSQPSIPIANATGVRIDTTTYDDTQAGGGAKLTTLVFPADQTAIAFAVEGDAYPRVLVQSDGTDGIRLGDGTFDPYNTNCGIAGSGVGVFIEGRVNLDAGIDDDPFRGPVNKSTGPFVIQQAALSSGSGVPDGRAGMLNDLYVRTDAPDINQWLYRCTTGGVAGVAVWAPVGGLT